MFHQLAVSCSLHGSRQDVSSAVGCEQVVQGIMRHKNPEFGVIIITF
jgi:hypothetical protein